MCHRQKNFLLEFALHDKYTHHYRSLHCRFKCLQEHAEVRCFIYFGSLEIIKEALIYYYLFISNFTYDYCLYLTNI